MDISHYFLNRSRNLDSVLLENIRPLSQFFGITRILPFPAFAFGVFPQKFSSFRQNSNQFFAFSELNNISLHYATYRITVNQFLTVRCSSPTLVAISSASSGVM